MIRAVLIGAASGLAVACAAAPTPEQQADVTAWGGADAVCIANGSTRSQVDGCRDMLREAFCGDGGVLAGSGGCAHVRLSDGGVP